MAYGPIDTQDFVLGYIQASLRGEEAEHPGLLYAGPNGWPCVLQKKGNA